MHLQLLIAKTKKENKAWHPNNDFFNPETRSQPMCLGKKCLDHYCDVPHGRWPCQHRTTLSAPPNRLLPGKRF